MLIMFLFICAESLRTRHSILVHLQSLTCVMRHQSWGFDIMFVASTWSFCVQKYYLAESFVHTQWNAYRQFYSRCTSYTSTIMKLVPKIWMYEWLEGKCIRSKSARKKMHSCSRDSCISYISITILVLGFSRLQFNILTSVFRDKTHQWCEFYVMLYPSPIKSINCLQVVLWIVIANLTITRNWFLQ